MGREEEDIRVQRRGVGRCRAGDRRHAPKGSWAAGGSRPLPVAESADGAAVILGEGLEAELRGGCDDARGTGAQRFGGGVIAGVIGEGGGAGGHWDEHCTGVVVGGALIIGGGLFLRGAEEGGGEACILLGAACADPVVDICG